MGDGGDLGGEFGGDIEGAELEKLLLLGSGGGARLALVGLNFSMIFGNLLQPAMKFFLGNSFANWGSAARRW